MTESKATSKEHQRRITNIESVCGIIDERIPFAKQRLEHVVNKAVNMALIDLDVRAVMEDLLTCVERMQTDNEQNVFDDLNDWFYTNGANQNEEALVVDDNQNEEALVVDDDQNVSVA